VVSVKLIDGLREGGIVVRVARRLLDQRRRSAMRRHVLDRLALGIDRRLLTTIELFYRLKDLFGCLLVLLQRAEVNLPQHVVPLLEIAC
jgi:hypothetical protein